MRQNSNAARPSTWLFLGTLIGVSPLCHATQQYFVPQLVKITASNASHYAGVLPTWRDVTPVGRLISTPNFPTKVLRVAGHVLVLANGATPFQTVTWYGADLRRQVRLAAFSGLAPDRETVITAAKGSAKALDPRHTGAAGWVYSTNQPERVRVAEAKSTVRVEENPQAIPTAIASHSDLFQGLAAAKNGVVYATGGESDEVLALHLSASGVTVVRRYLLQWQSFPKDQYPYTYQAKHGRKPYHFYPDSVAVGPSDLHLYVTGMLANSLARINIRTGKTQYVNVGSFPFAVILADGGRRLAISDWAGRGVTIVDRSTFKVLGTVPTGPALGPRTAAAGVHPTAMTAVARSPYIWVADANDDALVEVNAQALKAVRVIADSPYPDAPPGSYPDALTAAGGKLYVANAGNDDVAVYDIATGRRLGLIPTGWYPSSLTVGHRHLYVVAAKGFGTGPNLQWQYIGDMMHGLLQSVPLRDMSRNLPAWTHAVLRDDDFLPAQRHALAEENARASSLLRKHIHYVVFILRENKTFDEDFGDYQAAGSWANPHFDLYGPRELPNLYTWAAHNTLFTNFMADGEVTAQGHQWTDGASESDVVQRLWPEIYSHRGLIWNAGPGGNGALHPNAPGSHDPFEYVRKRLGDFTNPWISYPQRLYLFNDLLAHHISFEDFGEDITRARDGVIRNALLSHVDRTYPGWDRMILDTSRVAAAISWLKAHPDRAFPHFIFIWLPDDHTAGQKPCYYSPDYYVASNDHATAQFLHYLAGTPEWGQMVVFLDEDDAQSGADHINAHRIPGLAMGPWVKSGNLDKQPLSQLNIVRTIEAALDLPAMSQWDANARVISGIWRKTARRDSMPVRAMEVPPQFNSGKCIHRLLLRREAGAAGHPLTTRWLRRHTDPHGTGSMPLDASQRYTPTSILKVAGPEQLRQEWIASKGARSYLAFLRYLRAYAAVHGNTVASYEANDGQTR
jgi:YVTN family beta-propeller protein